MPDIVHSVTLTEELVRLVNDVRLKCGSDFNYWGLEDLQQVRSYIRNHYKKAQKGKCAYCRQNVSINSPLNCHVEHIAPKSLYPDFMFTPKNLCVICADCNTFKRGQETLNEVPNTIVKVNVKMYPRSSSAFKIVHPHFDDYDDHIVVSNGYYLNRTGKGHFTIGACDLNRKLRVFGWEPEAYNEVDINEIINNYLKEKDPLKKKAYLKQLGKELILA